MANKTINNKQYRVPFRGCLLFTWVNRSVHGSGKWYAKFRTGKFPSGNRVYHLYELVPFTGNGREALKLVSKMALKKWNTNFCLEYSVRKNRTTFSDVRSVAAGNFPLERPKKSCSIYFQTGFSGIFL